jgi:hypothetical protein
LSYTHRQRFWSEAQPFNAHHGTYAENCILEYLAGIESATLHLLWNSDEVNRSQITRTKRQSYGHRYYTHTHTPTHTNRIEGICQFWNDCVTCVMTSNGLQWILHLQHNFTANRHIIKVIQTSKVLIITNSMKTILVFC